MDPKPLNPEKILTIIPLFYMMDIYPLELFYVADRYPAVMNVEVVWPLGAVPGAKILQKHDLELFECELRSLFPPPSTGRR